MRTSLFLCSLAALTLTACGGVTEARKQFGLKKSAPDEFVVLRRAPLEVPPPEDLDLPAPRPGAERPQETAPKVAAKQALFGVEGAATLMGHADAPSEAEARFLDLAGVAEADPTVRAKINEETLALHNRNKPVAERLLNIGGNANLPSATVVDAPAEAARLKALLEAGQPINEGDTPSIEE